MKNKNWIYPLIVIGIFLLFNYGCKPDDKYELPSGFGAGPNATDIEGHVYHSLIFGTQTWLVEKLKTTKYRNGDLIGTTTPATLDITGEKEPKYQWAYNGVEDSAAIYGRLYTWYAVTDTREVCPVGWHIPSDYEWTTIEDYLIANGYNYDGTTAGNNIAKAMASKTTWILSANTGAVGNTDYPNYRNKSGFSALPGGYRNFDGAFLNGGISDDWWSSTEGSSDNAWFRNLYNSYSDVYRDTYQKSAGFSVLCLKD
jgi:uncharacterized protein (TIGR02145 family)